MFGVLFSTFLNFTQEPLINMLDIFDETHVCIINSLDRRKTCLDAK